MMDPYVMCIIVGMTGGVFREILSSRKLALPRLVRNGEGPRIVFGSIIPALISGAVAGLTTAQLSPNPVAVFLMTIGTVDTVHNGARKVQNKIPHAHSLE